MHKILNSLNTLPGMSLVEDVVADEKYDESPKVRLRHKSNFSIGDPADGPTSPFFDEPIDILQQEDYSPTHSTSTAHSPKQKADNSAAYNGFFEFFISELTRGYALENAEARYAEKRKKVYAFIKIPKELEKFLFFGLLQCSEAFLHIFTFLPLRFLMALYHLVLRWLCFLFRRQEIPASPSEICDILKIFILCVASLLMTFVDTSVMYHVVRGQAVIKLYIFFNMLEVADKLFSSFGQDILDALFWTSTEPRGRRRDHFGVLPHLIMAVVYVWLHSLLVLLQATTLNVAFNSHNKALLTIMMSNNFVELKGSVFKKFAKNNLFQMACSDVRERFHYLVLLCVVVLRNMTAVNWRLEHFFEMVPDLLLVVFGELLVDWIKHAFITKFNEIPFEVYKDFTITIAYDVAKSREKTAFSDHSDQVSRRMGFIPLPLSVLLIRIVTQSLNFSCGSCVILWLMAFVGLVLFKVFNSIMVLGKASKYIKTYEELQKQAELWKRMSKKRSKSVPASPRLSLIEFSDVMQMNYPIDKGFTASDILHQAAEIAAASSGSRTPYYEDYQQNVITNQQPLISQQQNPGSAKLKRRSKSVAHLKTPRSREPSGKRTTEDQKNELSVEEDTNANKNRPVDELESLQGVDRYTLVNNDRIES